MHWHVLKDHLNELNGNQSIIIEKPIVTTLDQYKALVGFLKQTKSSVHIGFQYRFHPITVLLKNIIENKEYGYFCYGDFMHSEDVRFWHPWEKYNESYSIDNQLGGGARLTLCHNLDTATYILGRPNTHHNLTGNALNNIDLETDADDWSNYILQYKSDGLVSIATFTQVITQELKVTQSSFFYPR